MQYPRAEGDGAVQAWIDLLPEWQTARAHRVDAVVTREAPNVHKAIKWHGAWYGVPGVDVPEIETRPNVKAGSTSKTLMETRCDGTKC